MFDWIIEADLHRLDRQYREAETKAERERLVPLIQAKRMQLGGAPGSFETLHLSSGLAGTEQVAQRAAPLRYYGRG